VGCDTGTHTIRLTNAKATNSPITETITIPSGDTTSKSYSFQMIAEESPPPVTVPDSGYIIAASSPRGATVFIDGVEQEQPTTFRFRVKTGSHVVRILSRRAEYPGNYVDTVDVERGKEITVYTDFRN
jgi:hypothetical protein